jgi:N-methylhydantoinase B
VRFRRYGLRPDSEGAGRFRGGIGLIRELTFLTDVTVGVISDRVKFRPWGIDGGGEGSGNRFWIESAAGIRSLRSKDLQRVAAGETLCIHTSGGGGYGDRTRREADALQQDVADGKISEARARSAYGWNGEHSPGDE